MTGIISNPHWRPANPNGLKPSDPGIAGYGFDVANANAMEAGSKALLLALHREHPCIMHTYARNGLQVVVP